MSSASERDPWSRAARCVPWVWGVAAFAIGLAGLYRGHPQEDAYILFEYARNLAHGDGIVFFPGGPRTEGATDFLWMLVLAGTVRIGIDVAVAACFWNALGAALASWILTRAALHAGASGAPAFVFAVLSGLVLGTCAGPAAWAGFSTMFYAALVLWLADVATAGMGGNGRRDAGSGAERDETRDLERSARVASSVRWTPFLALAVALVRPDGVAFALVFAFASAVVALRAGFGTRFARSAIAAGALGAAYFLWRRWYFGLALPLPLYVKGNGVAPFEFATLLEDPFAVLPGARTNAQWMASRFGPLPMLFVAGTCSILLIPLRRVRMRREEWKRAGLILLACGAFLALVSFGRQTQNHAFRIQAPAAVLAMFVAWRLVLAVACDGTRSRIVRSSAVIAFVACGGFAVSRTVAQFEWNERGRNYMDVFPVELGRFLPPEGSIALTEAGRLAFWTNARAYDLVGLDDARFALAPPTTAQLAEIEPDVVMFHVSDAVSLDGLDSPAHPSTVEIGARDLEAGVTAIAREVYEHGLARYTPGRTPESVAPAVMARFLVDHAGEYRIVAVRYFGRYDHVWGFRLDLPRQGEITRALRTSTGPGAWRSYAEVAGFPFAR